MSPMTQALGTMSIEHWDSKNRPSLGICPKHYCFHWIPPRGKADLSGRVYNSFEEAVDQSKMVTFLHGGCAAPFGHCRRDPNQEGGCERYEPHNSMLRDAGLPELFFCDPSVLDDEDKKEYEEMAEALWGRHA